MKFWARTLLATLALAALVHVAALWAVPRLIMARTIAAMDAAGALNAAIHPPRADDRARGVVMPSPDLLYTVCSFDVGRRPLRVSAPVPGTYWSVAFFAANTDNFFVLDDRGAGAPSVDILLVGPGQQAAPPPGTRLVRSPSRRGIMLFRTLIANDEELPALRQAQREQRCAPF